MYSVQDKTLTLNLQVHACKCKLNCDNIRIDTKARLLPGRVPGYKDTDVKLLPFCTTKRYI